MTRVIDDERERGRERGRGGSGEEERNLVNDLQGLRKKDG